MCYGTKNPTELRITQENRRTIRSHAVCETFSSIPDAIFSTALSESFTQEALTFSHGTITNTGDVSMAHMKLKTCA